MTPVQADASGAWLRCPRATPSGAPRDHLDQALSGQVLTETDFRVPALATVDLAGRTVDETVSRGKHLLTRIGRPHASTRT